MTVDLGSDFNIAVLELIGLTDVDYDSSTVNIGGLPETGDATVRVTRIVPLPVDQLRQLIAQYGGPVEAT